MTYEPSYHDAVAAEFQREADEQEAAEERGYESAEAWRDAQAELEGDRQRDEGLI